MGYAVEILNEFEIDSKKLKILHDILDRNQNPGCIGDRLMTESEFKDLRSILDSFDHIERGIRSLTRDVKNPNRSKYFLDKVK